MKNPRWAIQIWCSNGYAKPCWMNVSYRASLKTAVADKKRMVEQGTKPDNIRIVKL